MPLSKNDEVNTTNARSLSSLSITSEFHQQYFVSQRWWLVTTLKLGILFSITGYCYLKVIANSNIITLMSFSFISLFLWGVISFRILNFPYVLISDKTINIRNFITGQLRTLDWNDINSIQRVTNLLHINTRHSEEIPVKKKLLSNSMFQNIYSNIRDELNQRKSEAYKIGRYNVTISGSDAYISYDCYGSISTIPQLALELKRKKQQKIINRVYICVHGARKRLGFRITEKNLTRALKEAI